MKAIKDSSGRYYGSTVKIGPKGQIVIPKEIREMFGFEPGDSLFILADRKRGIAIQTIDLLTPMMKRIYTFNEEEEADEENE